MKRVSRKQRKRRNRRIIVGSFAIFVTFTVMIFIFIGNKYSDTKKWNKYVLGQSQAELPPSFIQNRYDKNFKEKLEVYDNLRKDVLSVLSKKEWTTQVESHLETAKKFEKTPEIMALVDRLLHYRDVLKFEQSAYSDVNNQFLSQLIGKQLKYQLDKKYEDDTAWLDRLNKLSSEYELYDKFYNEFVATYGSIDGSKFVVNVDVFDLTPLRTEAGKLTHFPDIKKLYDLLGDSSSVIKGNEVRKEFNEWQNVKSRFEKLKGSYTKVSDVKTYKEVKAQGWLVEGEVPKFVKDDSKVISVLYYATKLKDTDYVRSGVKPVVIMDWSIDKEAKEKYEKEEKEKEEKLRREEEERRKKEEETQERRNKGEEDAGVELRRRAMERNRENRG